MAKTKKDKGGAGVPAKPPVSAATKRARRSKQKGSGFERKIAVSLREALNLSKQDVFRAPNSGGHPFMRAGDLMLSLAAQKQFPFSVECKHHKAWTADGFFTPRVMERTWTEQALAATPKGLHPMLVVSGNNTGAYFACRKSILAQVYPELLKKLPRLFFRNPGDEKSIWVMMPWPQMLAHLRNI